MSFTFKSNSFATLLYRLQKSNYLIKSRSIVEIQLIYTTMQPKMHYVAATVPGGCFYINKLPFRFLLFSFNQIEYRPYPRRLFVRPYKTFSSSVLPLHGRLCLSEQIDCLLHRRQPLHWPSFEPASWPNC